MKKRGYDRIAAHYDWMSRLVFGGAQVRAQTDHLGELTAGRRLLIAGGGTGWILDELAKTPQALDIVYVETSEQMTRLSEGRARGNNRIEFVKASAVNYSTENPFDVIFTPFIFDHFAQAGAEELFANLDRLLVPGGRWIYADFKKPEPADAWWQQMLAKIMYRFFNLLDIVEVRHMPDMEQVFLSRGYRRMRWQSYYGGLIDSGVFIKKHKTESSL
ncbi:class I SAM-dependent methyltransferase [Pedobacter yulinensis]|nr:class I SAM-dependent methyltransferase [Pedobacter yulinensis]